MLELTPAPAKMPPGRRAYAIGDIHGDLNFWMSSGYRTDDLDGITVDGRPNTGSEDGFAKLKGTPSAVSS